MWTWTTAQRDGVPPLVVTFVVAVAVGYLWVPLAEAYCRARACDPDAPGGEACERDAATGCSAEGETLFRSDGCVYFGVQAGAAIRSLGLSDAEFEEAIQEAFDTWADVDCGAGPPSIIAQAVGPTEVDGPFACLGPRALNLDVWLVRDDIVGMQAVTPSSGATAGVTHSKIVPETGEIYDADVSLNELWFLVQDPDDVRPFLRVVATHEAGHALGLAHSQEEAAMMFGDYRVSDDRMLTPDDIRGICALYPPMSIACPAPNIPEAATDAVACEEARNAREVEPAGGSGGGCSVVPDGRGGDAGQAGRGLWPWAAALPACMLMCRIRQRRARQCQSRC